jgi:hypothetical protein
LRHRLNRLFITNDHRSVRATQKTNQRNSPDRSRAPVKQNGIRSGTKASPAAEDSPTLPFMPAIARERGPGSPGSVGQATGRREWRRLTCDPVVASASPRSAFTATTGMEALTGLARAEGHGTLATCGRSISRLGERRSESPHARHAGEEASTRSGAHRAGRGEGQKVMEIFFTERVALKAHPREPIPTTETQRPVGPHGLTCFPRPLMRALHNNGCALPDLCCLRDSAPWANRA